MTAESSFDPTAPLAGPPEPWAFASAPSLRGGPPYHLTDMIAAEPAVARRILVRTAESGAAAELASAIRAAADAGAPVVVTGCGTSETAGQGMVEIFREAFDAAGLAGATVVTEQAFELSLDPPGRGLVIGVSHEGGTSATNSALRAARAAGARTAVVTVSRHSPAAAFADLVVETGELDHSWCHSIGYVSPMLVAAAAGAALSGRPLDADRVAAMMTAGARAVAAAEGIGARLADATHLVVIGSGADRPAGREMALKVEEASWLPSGYRDLETFLHGHLPATGPDTGLVLILADRHGRAERLVRARQALAAARVIGLRAAAILGADLDADLAAELTPAGRLLVDDDPALPAPVACLFGTATALQLVTERLARARGKNPDLIRRQDERYRRAAEVSGG